MSDLQFTELTPKLATKRIKRKWRPYYVVAWLFHFITAIGMMIGFFYALREAYLLNRTGTPTWGEIRETQIIKHPKRGLVRMQTLHFDGHQQNVEIHPSPAAGTRYLVLYLPQDPSVFCYGYAEGTVWEILRLRSHPIWMAIFLAVGVWGSIYYFRTFIGMPTVFDE